MDVGVGVGAWGVVFLCMQVNKHAWMHKHECFLRQALLLAWNLLIQPSLLASESHGSAPLHLPGSAITIMCRYN